MNGWHERDCARCRHSESSSVRDCDVNGGRRQFNSQGALFCNMFEARPIMAMNRETTASRWVREAML